MRLVVIMRSPHGGVGAQDLIDYVYGGRLWFTRGSFDSIACEQSREMICEQEGLDGSLSCLKDQDVSGLICAALGGLKQINVQHMSNGWQG